ncbi:MAG TPA: gliding motility-associated C-terminal domain-containing protein [Mucilaginibacter sp.]|jgi:gliding motility-associated-like protein|nr:gliding motility-associated C-terminal domain-containing protein [Mucilaginibacter sp.]
MPYRNILTIFLILILHSKAFSTVFTVTSNADAGAGTFREALTQAAANGNAVKDYIYFNLSDVTVAGRTITILSALPGISSNLVIDGSTQPGAALGVSSAKVTLVFNSTGQNIFSALSITNQSDIEIYGLYIRLINTFTPRSSQPVGIQVVSTNNLQLGDVNKGNVIAGFFFPFSENNDHVSESSGLILKSNFFSIQSDGLTVTDDYAPNASNIYGNVVIGGTAAERNVFAKGMQLHPHNIKPCTINFRNNFSGINYNASAAFTSATLAINTDLGKTTNSVVNIEDNILCANSADSDVPLNIGNLGGVVNISRNYINVDRAQGKLGAAIYGVYVQMCKEVHIGTSSISDANYIGYCEPIFAENTGNLTFTKNSFFCTTKNYIYFDQNGQQRTQCNVTQITPNSVSGTATPNSLVDLYFTDRCKTCAPQTYFASVNADVSGKWTYNGTISSTVIANATYNNNSSDFSFTRINTDHLKITNECGGPASITGIQVFGATTIKWVDESGNTVGNDIDLLNPKPGKYKLLVDNGGCTAATDYYEILPGFTLDESQVVTTAPSCGNSTGSVIGAKIINSDDPNPVEISWTDANGKMWGHDLDLKNVPAGSYLLSANSKSNCLQTYGPVILQDQNRTVPPPSANNITLCGPGETFLNINSPLKDYTYNLYDSEAAITPLAKSSDGRFRITVEEDKTYYVSQAFYNCESTRTTVPVLVGLDKSSIPNAITPNGDGINDYWNIKGIEKYPTAIIQIFNRYGQKVVDMKGYTHPFDGTSNGSRLPGGVYYYIITLTAECHLSGSLTIIR